MYDRCEKDELNEKRQRERKEGNEQVNDGS